LKVPYEHIIVDGGSSDKTLEILSCYSHLKVLHQRGKTGMYGAIHEGFKYSKYDNITWLNCDDKIIPEYFQEALLKINRSNIDLIYGDGEFYWKKNNTITDFKANRFGVYFLKKGIIPFIQPCSIYKRRLYNMVELNYKEFKICGDLDMFMRMAYLPDTQFFYFNKKIATFLKYGASLYDLNQNLYIKERAKLIKNPSLFDKALFKLTKLI
jgi:glycosyltransferase involved in cell wall biosynthesis